MINLSPFFSVRLHPSGRAARALEALLGVDLRSAALFRAALATALVADAAGAGGTAFARVLAALLLLIGWRTRWMAFLSWLLVLHGGDAPLRGALFWAVFLPLGARGSVDAALETARRRLPKRVLTFGTLGFLTQVTVPYALACAGLLKTGPLPSGDVRWLAIAVVLPFLPSRLWEKLSSASRPEARAGLRIYYDAPCGFCRKSVHLLKTFLFVPEARVLEAQSDPAVLAPMLAKRSWVVRDASGGESYRYDAFLAIVRASPFGAIAPVLAWPPFAAAGEKLYGAVSERRGAAARLLAWCRFRKTRFEPLGRANVLAAAFLAYAVFWNLAALPGSKLEMPAPLRAAGGLLGLKQSR